MSAQPRILPVREEPPPLTEGSAIRPKRRGKNKALGRFQVLNAFVDFALSGLSRGETAVWLVLYRDSREGIARTSVGEIACRSGMSRRSVLRSVRSLEGRGLLEVVTRGGLNLGSSAYRVRGSAAGS
jgi:DNA-binding transcriptional ArsR family regulator